MSITMQHRMKRQHSRERFEEVVGDVDSFVFRHSESDAYSGTIDDVGVSRSVLFAWQHYGWCYRSRILDAGVWEFTVTEAGRCRPN